MSLTKLIEDFIIDSAKSSTPVADLLEQARTIADYFEEKNFVKFCEKELNGYDEEDDAPEHRLVEVITQSWYDGPQKDPNVPIYGTSTTRIDFFRKSIKSICEILSEKKDFEAFFKLPYDPLKDLYKNRIIVKRYFLQRIESEVRRKINDWKSQKIREGKFPLESEKNANIVINGPVNGANIISSMTNSSATINNNNNFDFETLKQLITKIETDLENAKNIEAEKAASLKEQITLLKKSAEEQNETSAMELLKNIAAGAISSGIWSIGSTITTFLSPLG